MDRKEKLRLNGIKKHGSESAWRAFVAASGSKGGKAKVPKGFAVTGKAKEAGAKGSNTRWGKV